MLRESSTGRKWFESSIQVLIFYSIIIYYIEAEMSERGLTTPGVGFWLWNERLVVGLFTFEYLYRWFHAKNRLRYPITLLALVDLLAILPSLVGLTMNFRSLKLARTLRILRLFKLYRYNTALQNVMHGFRKVKDELAIVGFVVVIVVMVSSVAMHELEHDAQPDKFGKLSDSVWWSFVTLTTVGYGDMYPVTLGGRLLAILTMVIGIGIFGTFISLIGSSFLSTMREEDHRHHMPTIHAEEDEEEAPWFDTQFAPSSRADSSDAIILPATARARAQARQRGRRPESRDASRRADNSR